MAGEGKCFPGRLFKAALISDFDFLPCLHIIKSSQTTGWFWNKIFARSSRSANLRKLAFLLTLQFRILKLLRERRVGSYGSGIKFRVIKTRPPWRGLRWGEGERTYNTPVIWLNFSSAWIIIIKIFQLDLCQGACKLVIFNTVFFPKHYQKHAFYFWNKILIKK